MKKIRVNRYKRKDRGKIIHVPSYNRKKRPKSKIRIKDKIPVKMYPVRDKYGRIMGYKV